MVIFDLWLDMTDFGIRDKLNKKRVPSAAPFSAEMNESGNAIETRYRFRQLDKRT